MPTCEISGQKFEISDFEQKQREKLGVPLPKKLPKYLFRELGTFWAHFSIHKRKSNYSQKEIVSVYSEDCPYPVWHREEWIKENNPPKANYDYKVPFFEQLWTLFQKCPIPHNTGIMNENCEFTDDFWHSKNCYLCHSGLSNEDLSYCFRLINCKDCQFSVFSFDSEVCTDLINSRNCYNVDFAINSRNCRDAAFLFDCRNVSDSLFCWNLRNKQYCIANKQYSKAEYFKKKEAFSLASRKNYDLLKKSFLETIFKQAWWKNQQIEKCENSLGDFLENDKNCLNCFFVSENEDCINTARSGAGGKDNIDCLNVAIQSELCHTTAGACDQVYKIQYSQNIAQSKFLEYCAFCEQCENCFACCGLLGKKYHILNKPYNREDYFQEVEKIKAAIKKEGVYGDFFPGYFAAIGYEESWSGVHFPLTKVEQKSLGFRSVGARKIEQRNYTSLAEIPDSVKEANQTITQKVFWDSKAERPFQIMQADLLFAKNKKVPLPNSFYLTRLKENFALMFFNGELRKTQCAHTGKLILTALPSKLDGRILSEEAYFKIIN